jgi:cytochrome P450
MLLILLLVFALYILYVTYLYPRYLSPLRHLPGPPPGSFPFLGNLPEIFSSDVANAYRRWLKAYGPVYRVHGLFNEHQLLIADPALIQYIFGKHPYEYPKPRAARKAFEVITKNGLLVAEGMDHKRQKKYLQAVFHHKHIVAMAPTMFRVARQLVERWKHHVVDEWSEMIVDDDVSRATLDIIGQVAFGHEFNALDRTGEPIYEHYQVLLHAPPAVDNIVAFLLPMARAYLPSYRRVFQATEAIDDILANVVSKRWQCMQAGHDTPHDLLGALLERAQLQEEEDGITQNELMAQMHTFASAGHATIATVLMWAIHELASDALVQSTLRAEIRTHFPRGIHVAPSADDLNRLHYLDMVIKEIQRLNSVAPTSSRCASVDDTLPNGLFVPKGTQITIFKTIMHTLPSVWGEDADTFRPERWNELDPTTIPHFSYIYFPFLVGARGCIGSKLALLELKMVIACLINQFEFRPAYGHTVCKKFGVVNKPMPYVKVQVRVL